MKDFNQYQEIVKKLESGNELQPEEVETFEKLKADFGITPAGTVRTMEIAAGIIGVTRRTLCNWKKEPDFPIELDGTYDPEKIAVWRGLGVNGKAEGEIISEKLKWEIHFRKFRAKLSEVSYKKERGELISRAEVETLLVDRAVEFKKALLSRGRRLSLRLAHKDSQECQRILDEDSLQTLETYSRENPLTDKAKPRSRKVKSGKKKS